ALAQTAPTNYCDFLELAVASAASDFPAPKQGRQFFAFSADAVRLIKQPELDFFHSPLNELRELNDLADEATTAARQNDPRKCCKVMNRIAPQTTPASVAVAGPDGLPCVGAPAETQARKQALLNIFIEVPLCERPPPAAPPPTTAEAQPLQHLLHCTTSDAEHIVDLVPDREAAAPFDATPGGHLRPRGVVAELGKLA
ncbi:unnamed protein product, partial [Prorocentrum cordatum]